MTEREKAVREAMRSLALHGLQITGLKCHPETLLSLINEMMAGEIKVVHATVEECIDFSKMKNSYLGIPIEQDANVEV